MTSLKRRQFVKLAAASLTSTVVADFSSKALAQKIVPTNETVYGLNIIRTSKLFNREAQSPPIELFTAELTTAKLNLLSDLLQPVVNILSKIDLPVLSVNNLLSAPKLSQALFVSNSDRITKAIVLADKTLLISTVTHTRRGHFNYLTSVVGSGADSSFSAKQVIGLKGSNQTVESILSLPNNQLLCLLGNQGTPPYSMTTLDYKTGQIISDNKLALPPLPPTHLFANLCQDPKGNIYATEMDDEGVPILISMNLQETAIATGYVKINRLFPLSVGGRYLNKNVKDLAFSPSSGQLYALATDQSGKNAVFLVNQKTGNMELFRNFAADKFAVFS